MNRRAGLAGAIGETAGAVIGVSAGSADLVLREREGVVFAYKDVQSTTEKGAFLGILGQPRIDSVAHNQGVNDDKHLETWCSALFGPTGDLDGRLAGHFAAFYCDISKRQVALCTDRFGTYPVYYRCTDNEIAFATDADLLFDSTPAISAQAIFDYLYFHCLPAPETVHDGVQRLEAGSILNWQDGRLAIRPYWNRSSNLSLYRDFAEARQDFYRLLRDAVRREHVNETTGAFLSGGTDSSTVAGILAERSEQPIKTFSIGFDVRGYDEANYARLAARHFGTDHQEYYVTPDDLVARLPTMAASLDQPFGNSSILPAMICAERARDEGVTRLLAGDGGDELFGGNTRYAKQKVFDWYQRVPTGLRRRLIEPVTRRDISRRLPLLRKLKSYVEQAEIPMPHRMETYNILEREGPENILCSNWLAAADPAHPRRLQSDVWDCLAANDTIDRMLEFDWKFTLADNDLRKVRYAAAMANIEVGFPLLDDDIVSFSLRLPPEWKVRRTKIRWFFKEALRGFLPTDIIHKKKHGFGLPFGAWVCEHQALRDIAESALFGLVERGIVESKYVSDLLETRLPKYPFYYGELVWVLMILELWFRTHSSDWHL